MKTQQHKENSPNSHINVTPMLAPAAQTPGPAGPPVDKIEPPIPRNPALDLLPRGALERQFRAASFCSKLNELQRSSLSLWLANNDLSIEDIRKKVLAPPPQGFGLEVQPTTLRRLRAMVRNSEVGDWFSSSIDTACDLLVDSDTAEVAPLRESLRLMLYSRAVFAAKNHADPSAIDKIVTTIGKVERLAPRSDRASHKSAASPPITTSHKVELTVRTDPRDSRFKSVHAAALPSSPDTTPNQNRPLAPESCNVQPCDRPK